MTDNRPHTEILTVPPFGSPVFACAGKTEPPSLLILSQTSAGKSYRFAYVIAGSSSFGVHLALDDQAAWACCVSIRPCLEVPAVGQNAPGNAGELVGKRDRQHVVM